MRHLSEAELALFAGGDLGRVAKWTATRHLAKCDQCREEVSRFSAALFAVSELVDTPEVLWNQIAPEIKANIRLGLAAGECVPALPEQQVRFSTRAWAVALSALTLIVAGIWLQRPIPGPKQPGAILLEATRTGINLNEGGQVLSLLHGQAKDITLSVSAQGAMRARYMDDETGHVTINNLYVQ